MNLKLKRKSLCAYRTLIPLYLMFLLFVSPGVAQKIPSPEEFLGFKVGADYHLATFDQAYIYFKALEKASPLIKIYEFGKSETGKPLICAIISSQDNLLKMERFKEISKKMSLVKGLTDEEARRLAAEGKAIVYIDGGLHASEVAPAQQNIQLAFDMLASEDPDIELIRSNVILLLVFPNPDGMDMVAEWYHSNIGTPFEVSPLPWLYNKYIGHDNNRDSYMMNSLEIQHLTRLINKEWFPQVLYNQHQTAPFPARIWIPPIAEPSNPNVHPLLVRGKTIFGVAMGSAFERENKPGAISRSVFEGWHPGYVTTVCDHHNIISLLSETALYRYATPRFYTLDDLPEEYRDFTPSVFYPNPWRGGWWRLKDAVDYCLTASKGVLYHAAIYREKLLWDKYKMGQDIIARFEKESPYAWIIPQAQWDPPTAALLLNKMIELGIDVYQAEDPFASDGVSYPPGTWIIPMNQPFALFVKAVFEVQVYPDMTKYPALWQGVARPQKFANAYLPPYDIAGWTLPYQMGVKAETSQSPIQVKMAPVRKAVPQTVRIKGEPGSAYLLSPRVNNSYLAINRILKKGGDVLRAKDSFSLSGERFPSGTFIVLSRNISGQFMASLAQELSLDLTATSGQIPVKTSGQKSPRVALYRSWVANMDEGWTRWLLDRFEFPFANIHDAEMKAGELSKSFDVVVIPSQSPESIIHGHRLGTIPPKYAGGMTMAGVDNLKKFADEGGTLVLMNDACLLATEAMNVPVANALKDVSRLPEATENLPKAGPSNSSVRAHF